MKRYAFALAMLCLGATPLAAAERPPGAEAFTPATDTSASEPDLSDQSPDAEPMAFGCPQTDSYCIQHCRARGANSGMCVGVSCFCTN